MKAFWKWLLSILGFSSPSIPQEIFDDTTAYVDPENFIPDEELIDDLIDDEEEIEEELKPSKYAVLVGINKYDPSLNSNLNGCVNDVEGMYKVLTEIYKFPPENIRVLTDERATKEMIIERIEWLLDHDVPGDELVLHNSSHGSQIRDRNGDELNDYMDEILCPTDLDWDDPFTDDEINWIFNQKADGVFLTFICDSCHSGSITKTVSNFPSDEKIEERPRYIRPPFDIKSREGIKPLPLHKIGGLNKNEREFLSQNHVLLSGCRDDQTSADAYIDGKWQGALTSSLIAAIKKNPYRDWSSIHADVISILNVGGYTQRPQLTGEDNLIKGRNIFGA